MSSSLPSADSNLAASTASDSNVVTRSLPAATAQSEALEILLVEDNIDHLFLARRELDKNLLCRITTAESAEEALGKIQASADKNQPGFDVVLADNGLPGMSGLDMLTHLRDQGDTTPVIIVAGQGSETIAVEALRRGAADYIVKSGDFVGLFPRVIEKVVERDRIQRRNEHLESEHIRFARLAAIGEVATGIAHEIRNPLAVISGMASVIRDFSQQLSPDDINKCARTIVENCAHLNRVLEEVLRSAQPTQHEPLLLSELLEETLSFMRFDPSFRHSLQVEPDWRTEGRVMGSRDQLKQVFINLFRNAAQSVEMLGQAHGSLKISLQEVTAADGDATEILVVVEDNGSGIPADVLPNIFESGFSTKHHSGKAEGNGLGLSISRRIIESHDGRIWAEAREPGLGAVFCIALPRHPSTIREHRSTP